jgi:hypothetical protein
MKQSLAHYIVEPDVAGGLGDDTVMDDTVHPPIVSRLHYEFDDWFGDVLLESFPCFIVTEDAQKKIEMTGLTGAKFDNVQVTETEDFKELCSSHLPKFVWLRIDGKLGEDDFSVMSDGRLVVSRRALDLLKELGIPQAIVSALDNPR